MKKLISIITILFVMFTATGVFPVEYDAGCVFIQSRIIENVQIGEQVGARRKMNGSSIIAASQMTVFWLELFKLKGCSNIILDKSANLDSLTNGLIKALEKK